MDCKLTLGQTVLCKQIDRQLAEQLPLQAIYSEDTHHSLRVHTFAQNKVAYTESQTMACSNGRRQLLCILLLLETNLPMLRIEQKFAEDPWKFHDRAHSKI